MTKPGIDAGHVGAIDQVLFYLVGQQVACSHASIDIEAGDAVGMVMVEHQPGALIVGIVEGQSALGFISIVHVGTLFTLTPLG